MPKSKKSTIAVELPLEVLPTVSSSDLLHGHFERAKARGIANDVIARAMGFGANNVSQLKSGKQALSLPRVRALARELELSAAETFELMTTRLLELHGQNGDFCIEALAQWATDLHQERSRDEKALLCAWQQARVAAPHLDGLLDSPHAQSQLSAALGGIVQAELKAMVPPEQR